MGAYDNQLVSWSDDPDIKKILSQKYIKVGKYKIIVSKILIRNKNLQRPSRKTAEQELVNLSQLIEVCRFTNKPPQWFPRPLIGRYDAYLIRLDERGLIGLNRHQGLEYNAVGWIEQETLKTRLIPEKERPGKGQMNVRLTRHCIQQYLNRWAPQTIKIEDAPRSLEHIISQGTLLPDFPNWFDDYDYGTDPASFVILAENEKVMIPTKVESHDRPHTLVAKTFLFRDMHLFPGNRLPEKERINNS